MSTLTGGLVDPERITTAGYWVEHVRRPVRFADAVRTLEAQGATTFVEIGPDAVLTALARETFEADAETAPEDTYPPTVLPLLRRGRSEAGTLVQGLGLLHARGTAVDWQAFYGATGARRVELPTYAFRSERYWLTPTAGAADASGLGLTPTGHPLLGTALPLAGGDGYVFTSRLSVRTHPWLEQHGVLGNTVLSAASLVETAVRAGDEAGAGVLEELSLTAPLVLSVRGAVQLQVRVGAPDADGGRPLTVHARPEAGAAQGEGPWAVYAHGRLGAGDGTPPRDREAGARTAGTVSEVRLPAELAEDAHRFGLHPALLDAVLLGHPFGERAGAVTVPAEWRGVRLHATGATAVRAVVTETGGRTVAVELTDEHGRPVATVEAVTYRDVPEEQFAAPAGGAQDVLLRLEWTAVGADGPAAFGESGGSGEAAAWAVLGADRYDDLAAVGKAVEAGAPIDTVVVPWTSPADRDASAALDEATGRATALVRDWLAEERLAATRLVVVTRGGALTGRAGAPGAAEPVDPVAAAVRGLLRSVQAEEEAAGRLLLADADPVAAAPSPHPSVEPGLLTALLASGEPEAAVREGRLLVPRLVRVTGAAAAAPAPVLDAEGTVLVTGGTLGRFLARHLAARYGVRHLLFVDPQGAAGPGAADLAAELATLGAEMAFAACDPADREALAAALAGIDAEHPLTAVVHAAGAHPGAPDSAGLRRMADGARNLHDLTRDTPLAVFLTCGSAAGTVPEPGSGHRAAAEAFMDALAAQRAADGLPALSLAWGPWEAPSVEDGAEAEAEAEAEAGAGAVAGAGADGPVRVRARAGFRPLASERAAQAFDAALATAGPPQLLAALISPSALRRAEGGVPPLLSGLVRHPVRPVLDAAGPDTAEGTGAAAGALVRLLAGLDEDGRHRAVRELVRREVAAVLGHGDPAAVALERSFQDAGFDSMTAVELRNRLGAATGLKLPATVVFDHPSPAALIRFVLNRAAAAAGGPAADSDRPSLLIQLDRLEAAVAGLRPQESDPDPDLDLTAVGARLRTLLDRLAPAAGAHEAARKQSHDTEDTASRIATASADEIFDFIDTQLGRGPGR
ncbi:KR domain-containing protein [Streptomyces sp. NPDC032472]|uniref:KR domain-containing protein n=1 Tax=Streptomyces sp. NPDC032472 TaxID=3155018 RepID=UPI0033E2E545